MTERRFAEALHAIADDVTVPPLPTNNLWQRGRRRYRRRVAATVGAAGVLAAAVMVPLLTNGPAPGAGDVEPAGSRDAVPSAVYLPLPFQRTVQQAPAGAAALIVSGHGSLRGSDTHGGYGYEGRTLVVSRNGRYRLVNGADEGEVGEAHHLSPDGRYLAASGPVEGTDTTGSQATSLVDLTTGRVRAYPAGTPVGWAPDGRHLLVRGTDPGGSLALLDIESGRLGRALALTGDWSEPLVTFAPDGARLAVQLGSALRVVDVATGVGRTPVELGPRRRLAGPGAWTTDGRLAVWDVIAGCDGGSAGGGTWECDPPDPTAGPGAGEFRMAFLDARSGKEMPGPEFVVVRGETPRLLGWQSDGDAVVETYHPAPVQTIGPSTEPTAVHRSGELSVVALRPGGAPATLIDLPTPARHVDVARDLLESGRFGGAPPPITARLGDWLYGLAGPLTLIAAALAALFAARPLRRRLRARRAAGAAP